MLSKMKESLEKLRQCRIQRKLERDINAVRDAHFVGNQYV